MTAKFHVSSNLEEEAKKHNDLESSSGKINLKNFSLQYTSMYRRRVVKGGRGERRRKKRRWCGKKRRNRKEVEEVVKEEEVVEEEECT
ncbi:hypothetical protein BHM03_00036830 [Ensete ventricosum]|nr:hypothetical protein BHM03_00036830 [Ensete ventricosum]